MRSDRIISRRTFIASLAAILALLAAAGVAALASPFAAFAQTQKLARIGFLGTGSAAGMAKWIEAFRTGLRELGYIEGKNLTIEYRWARKLGIELQQFPVRAARELQGAFAAMAAKHIEAAVIIEDGLLNAETRTIAEFGLAKRLPIIGLSELAKAGAMMAYGVSFPEMYHRAAVLVDKILKGAKPGDLPIQRPTRFEFTVNLKTARTLGIAIPPSLLLRADQVIE